jgi:hypothetical protein
MKQNDEIPMSIRCIVPFAKWMEKHPVLSNIILIIEAIALMYVVLTYNFTTHI